MWKLVVKNSQKNKQSTEKNEYSAPSTHTQPPETELQATPLIVGLWFVTHIGCVL